MGLDSVELLMEWEKFFPINIPDQEAEKMETIAEAVTYISNNITFVDRETDIKENVLTELKNNFKNFGLSITLTDLLLEVLPATEEQTWKEIARQSKFELPLPFSTSKMGRFFEAVFPSKQNFVGLTVDRYCDLVCAVNYVELITPGKIKNNYEVMIAVMGMTIDKIGVSPFEVYWESSFTNDLGVD